MSFACRTQLAGTSLTRASPHSAARGVIKIGVLGITRKFQYMCWPLPPAQVIYSNLNEFPSCLCDQAVVIHWQPSG